MAFQNGPRASVINFPSPRYTEESALFVFMGSCFVYIFWRIYNVAEVLVGGLKDVFLKISLMGNAMQPLWLDYSEGRVLLPVQKFCVQLAN